MKRTIRRTTQVRDDIIEIYGYIHERSPQAAEKVLDAIEASIRSLLITPGVGRYWLSGNAHLDGMRVTTVHPFRNYLIFFRAVSSGIEVFRILHAARDIEPLIDDIQIDFDDQ
jgi:plasmid stabilization system protein ParE